MATHQALSSGFPASGEEEWRDLAGGIAAAIGAGQTDDGLTIAPIYPRNPEGGVLWSRPGNGQWTIVQPIAADGIDGALDRLHADISGGTGAVELLFSESAHPMSGLLSASVASELAERAEIPKSFAIRINAGEETTNIAEAFVGHIDGGGTHLSLSLDPIAVLAARGRLGRSIGGLVGDAARSARQWRLFGGTILVADGRIWHAAGATEVQELAAVLASFVAYLRSLDTDGFDREWAAAHIGFVLAADADQLLTIAKFRAMRLLHARVGELAGLPSGRCSIHAETAWRMMSRRDPRINLLRTTGAAFAAAVGGADSIAVLPFDLSEGVDGTHARRLACNTQLILASESHAAATADPGAGSGAVENVTDALAAAAWAAFQEIEAEGGMAASVHAGAMQRRIAAARRARLARVVRGERKLIGVNAFTVDDEPDPKPPPPRSPAAYRHAEPAETAETAEPLVFTRLSESFESNDPRAGDRRNVP